MIQTNSIFALSIHREGKMKKCNAKLSPLVRCQKEIDFGTFGSQKPAPSGFGKGMGALSGVVGRVPPADATNGGCNPPYQTIFGLRDDLLHQRRVSRNDGGIPDGMGTE